MYYYFLAYKLILNDSEKTGWVSFDNNANNGHITIKDGDYTDHVQLIILKKITNKGYKN